MNMQDCIKRIDNYLRSDSTQPRFVNFKNIEDLSAFKQHYNVTGNTFRFAKNYSKYDEMPQIDMLFNDLQTDEGNIFISDFTTQLSLLGEVDLKNYISQFIHLNSMCLKIVIIGYQCEKYLNFTDPKYSRLIYDISGIEDSKPEIVFCDDESKVDSNENIVHGIENIGSMVETKVLDKLIVITKKRKSSYPNSLYMIAEQGNAYELICLLDNRITAIKKEVGSEEQWSFLLKQLRNFKSLEKYFNQIFASCHALEINITNWSNYNDNEKWLFFLALKLFCGETSWCLYCSSSNATNVDSFVRNIYRSILSIDHSDKTFWERYNNRKKIINALGNNDFEVLDYCSMVKSKGRDAIYYLTDLSEREKQLVFELLNEYGISYNKEELMELLSHIYPDLFCYLKPYHFSGDISVLLNSYFDEYKYQKVINRVLPNFENVISEQAAKRDFNLLLPRRSEEVDKLDKSDSALYFVDAMGIEYLSYITEKCSQKKLLAYATVCRCELPSITSMNKEFVDTFIDSGAIIIPDKNGIKGLDNIKHHGVESIDDASKINPFYISKELELINEIIDRINTKLSSGEINKAYIISDHGASRLSVIYNRENKWEMTTKGIHSGRCCPKSEVDEQPDCATEENNFWVLANYDRFKGGNKAQIEVHGGASLEEVAIPIIEISRMDSEVELIIIPENSDKPDTIKFSVMKRNAKLKVFSKTKLKNVSVQISGNEFNMLYDVKSDDGQNFIVNIPELKKAGKYIVDVYTCHNKIGNKLSFIAEKEGFGERKLF